MQNDQRGKTAEKVAEDYFLKKGYKIERPKKKKGFDFLAKKKGQHSKKIEVKGTHNTLGGIPDMHFTEFEEKKGRWYLKADILCIVRLKSGYIEFLTKKIVDRYLHKSVIKIKVSSKLKTDLKNEKISVEKYKF